jgi:hypothetical protein
MPAINVRHRVASVATLSAAAIAIAVPSAFAAGHHAATSKEVFQLAGTAAHAEVIAHGAFTDGGRDDTSHEAYDVLHMSAGTLRINHPDKDSKFKQHINPKTCYAVFSITGKYTLNHGTGKYKGVTGHGTYKGAFTAITKRNKDGSCNMNAEPTVEITTINASGPVNL